MNNKKVLFGSVLAVLLVVVAGYLLLGSNGATASGKTFFTVDDGKTYIAADARLIPPCTLDGKTAVLAYVFRCPTCGKQFVGNMGRYRADRAEAIRNRLVAKPATGPGGRPLIAEGPTSADMEMKRPGEPESAWKMRGASPNMAALMKEAASGANLIHCPDHRDVVAEAVMP